MRVLAVALALVFAVIMPSQIARTMATPAPEHTLTLTEGYASWNPDAQLDTSQIEQGEYQPTESWDEDTATDAPGDTTPDDGEQECAAIYLDNLPTVAIEDLVEAGWINELADGEEALYSPDCY